MATEHKPLERKNSAIFKMNNAVSQSPATGQSPTMPTPSLDLRKSYGTNWTKSNVSVLFEWVTIAAYNIRCLELAKQRDYDYVFIASDEQYRVDCIKQAFGDKVIEYDVTFRSISDSPLHYHNSMQCSKYYVGEDVIIEAYLLAKTNMLLCCTNSNVNYFARALNLEIPYKLL